MGRISGTSTSTGTVIRYVVAVGQRLGASTVGSTHWECGMWSSCFRLHHRLSCRSFAAWDAIHSLQASRLEMCLRLPSHGSYLVVFHCVVSRHASSWTRVTCIALRHLTCRRLGMLGKSRCSSREISEPTSQTGSLTPRKRKVS